MNFECHITINVADATHGQYFADNAPPYSGKWKTSEIARDPVLGQATYFYLTAHDTAYEKMHERMVYCRRWLQERGVVVLREKIELIMYDTKSGNAQLKAVEELVTILCGPEGKCCIGGSDADRAEVDKALATLWRVA